MKKSMKGFVIGLIVATMLMSTAVGERVMKTIDVIYNSVNITVNGEKVATDNLLYEGTTYVPLRAISEMLGKEVGWNGDTNTASINDKGEVGNVKGTDGYSKDYKDVKVSSLPLDIKILKPDSIGNVYMEATIKNNTGFPVTSYSTTILLRDENEKTYLSTYDTIMPGETSPNFSTSGPKTEDKKDIERLETSIKLDLGNGKYARIEYNHKLDRYDYAEYENH